MLFTGLKTDLAWVIFAGGTVCHPGRAAVEFFKDDFLSLDDQLTDTACVKNRKNKLLQRERRVFSTICFSKHYEVLPTKPVLMPAVFAIFV